MNNPRIAAAIALIILLAERWPKCFSVFERSRRPLKIGIFHDVMAALGDSVSRTELKDAFRFYCGNVWYLSHSCYVGTPRIDVDGNVAGVVTEEEAQNAATSLTRRRKNKASNHLGEQPSPKGEVFTNCDESKIETSAPAVVAAPKRLSLNLPRVTS